jgi:hypothetical protein
MKKGLTGIIIAAVVGAIDRNVQGYSDAINGKPSDATVF